MKNNRINKSAFRYSKEWYGEYYALWLNKIHSADDLLKLYKTKPLRYTKRWDAWFRDIELTGNTVLELGFNNGWGCHMLWTRYMNKIIVDGLDWNKSLARIIPFVKKASPCIRKLWIGDCNDVDKTDGYYDTVVSIDFYEHLPEEIYFLSIKTSLRLLKCGGLFLVYFGKPNNTEHINLRYDRVVIRDVVSTGFEFIQNSSGLLVFRKSG